MVATGKKKKKRQDISLSSSHTEHNASSLELCHVYLVREVHLLLVSFEGRFRYVLVLYSFLKTLHLNCYYCYYYIVVTMFLMQEVCVCCSRAMFPSLSYLQKIPAFRPALSLILCQGTLQLNFFQILFFLDTVTKMCCRQVLNKDRFVSKLHSCDIAQTCRSECSRSTTGQQPLVAGSWWSR